MHEIYALKDILCKQLEEYGRKGELNAAILERVDMLAHAVKNLDKIIESYEGEEEYSNADGTSYRGRSYRGIRPMSRDRGTSMKRDNMGRYSRYDGNSYTDGMEDMVDSIRSMMNELPQEVQRDAQRFVQKLENQM